MCLQLLEIDFQYFGDIKPVVETDFVSIVFGRFSFLNEDETDMVDWTGMVMQCQAQ